MCGPPYASRYGPLSPNPTFPKTASRSPPERAPGGGHSTARVSSPQTRTRAAAALAKGGPRARAPAQLPSPRARLRPTGRRAILTQARKGDGGVVLGAGLLGAVRVWAEAGGCLPAVVRLLLLRGHGQAALPGRPAGGFPWLLRGAPAQDGLNGEAGDAAGRRTPLARIFLAAHPGFIRNRRKPRTPFRDDLGGRWCRQAGRGGGRRGGESGGGGDETGETSPQRGVHADTGRLSGGVLAHRTLGTPAQPQRECPFFDHHQLAGSPAARRWRGLICIEVTGTRPIAAPPSGPGNFQKTQARQAAPVHLGVHRGPGRYLLCLPRDSQGRKQHRFPPKSPPL